MSGTKRFCTTCGSELLEGAQFCTTCGAPTAAPAPAATPAPVAPAPPQATQAAAPAPVPATVAGDERVIAVIPNAIVKGGFLGFKSKSYTLVLTNRRVVFAHITTPMMKQLVADARDSAKADGKGFMGQWGAQLAAYSTFAQGYLSKSAEEALAQTPENFAIERSAIVKAKVKVGHTDAENNTTADRLIIKTVDKKKYNITLQAGAAQAKKALIAAEMI